MEIDIIIDFPLTLHFLEDERQRQRINKRKIVSLLFFGNVYKKLMLGKPNYLSEWKREKITLPNRMQTYLTL